MVQECKNGCLWHTVRYFGTLKTIIVGIWKVTVEKVGVVGLEDTDGLKITQCLL